MAERYSTDEVQALADEFIRFKRYVEDVLENLPDMGMTESSVKKLIAKYGETSSAGFEAYADAEKAIAEMFAKYEAESAMTIASIKATADTNKSDISLLSSRVDGAYSDISGIQLQSDANGAFVSMFAVASPFDIDASKGYTYDKATNKYIFKNSNGENVDVYPADFAGIYINAMNNNYSEIRLNAKTIAFGNSAVVDDSGLKVTRIWDNESNASYYAKVYSKLGDFGIYSAEASATSNPASPDCLWGVYNGIDGLNFMHDGNSYMSIGADSSIYPKGDWNFSMCNVSNIPLYFS